MVYMYMYLADSSLRKVLSSQSSQVDGSIIEQLPTRVHILQKFSSIHQSGNTLR